MFTTGEKDDTSDGNQVRELQEQLCKKSNDMAVMMLQLKTTATQLNAEGKILKAIPSTLA